jgi:hypothetical protein
MSSIDQLKALASQKGGMARPNVFRVFLPSMPGATAREINLLCKDVSLPGRQILTRERTIGLTRRKIAYGYAQEDVSMTFLCLNDYGIKKYFDVWQNRSVNQTTKEIQYTNDYTFPVKIEQLRKGMSLPVYKTALNIPTLPTSIQNRLPSVQLGGFNLDLAQGEFSSDFITGDDVVYSVTLEDAFPTTMNAIQLNNEQDGLVELNIQLSYTNWIANTNEYTEPNDLKDLANVALGTALGKLFN